MRRIYLFPLSLTLSAQLFAQPDDSNYEAASPEVVMQQQEKETSPADTECVATLRKSHIGVRHNEARGIGYKDGYTTLEGFAIFDEIGDWLMPFIDLRGHVFNNGKLAGNIGIGERTIFPSIGHIFGSYVYYDVRQNKHHLTVNQISPGIELVGKRMEYRINGYFPVGRRTSNHYDLEFDKFKGNNFFVKLRKKHAMTGGDAEVGVHMTRSSTYDVYAGAGPYYFSNEKSAWGGRARIYGRYKDYATIEGSYSYDHLFRSVVQGSISLSIPFGGKIKRKGQGCPKHRDLLLDRAAFAPTRFEIPVVKSFQKKKIAINPVTGAPWNVIFVNNTSHSLGTFESPFSTLLQAQNASVPNDIIYVFPGDGTTTGMNAGITLKNFQKFYGSGTAHRISTTQGRVTIPAMTAARPQITNSSTVVFVSSGNEVSGFDFSLASQTAIALLSAGTNGCIITDNNFTASGNPTVILMAFGTNGLHGNIIIKDNSLINTGSTSSIAAILVQPDTNSTLTGGLFNNTITNFNRGVQINLENPTSVLSNFEIAENVFNTVNPPFCAGVWFMVDTASTQTSTAIIRNNIITSNEYGMFLFTNGAAVAQVQLTIDGNQISSAIDAINIGSQNAGTNWCSSIEGNTLQAGGKGVAALSAGGARLCLRLSNNHSPSGYSVTGIVPGVINLEPITNNIGPFTITGNVNNVPAETCCD